MPSRSKPCPACGKLAVSFKHTIQLVNTSARPVTLREVPSVVYICENDGWFALSEPVNETMLTTKNPYMKDVLAEKIAEKYFPEGEQPLSLKPIENLP